MKKLFVSTLLLLSIFLLAGCDQKKEVKMSVEETHQMLSEVKAEESFEEVIALKATFDLKVKIATHVGEKVDNVDVELSGSVELYTTLKSYEAFFIKGKLNLTMLMRQSEDAYMSYKLNGNLYVIGGTLYLDGKLETKTKMGGLENTTSSTLTLKQSDFFSEEEFNSLRDSFVEGESSIKLADLIEADTKFKVYKVKGGHLLELDYTLAEFLNLTENQLPEASLFAGITEDGENELKLSMVVSNIIESLSIDAKINVKINNESEMFGMSGSIHGSFNVDFNMRAKKPSMPNVDTFSSYTETEDIFDTIFGGMNP